MVYDNFPGAKSTGWVEASPGGLLSVRGSQVEMERGKSGNHAGDELDRYSAVSFSTGPIVIYIFLFLTANKSN